MTDRVRAEGIEILLVEDNPGDVYLTLEVLRLGAIRKHVSVAEDGEEALNFLNRARKFQNAPRPDLIILDLNLPKLDGREVLDRIKADPNLRQIPVIILSTSKVERDVTSAYNHHANCYVSKPTDLDDFFDVVRGIEEYWLKCVRLPAAS